MCFSIVGGAIALATAALLVLTLGFHAGCFVMLNDMNRHGLWYLLGVIFLRWWWLIGTKSEKKEGIERLNDMLRIYGECLQMVRDVMPYVRVIAKFDAERDKILQLICFNNPVPDDWQPLPETCEGVEQRPTSEPGN